MAKFAIKRKGKKSSSKSGKGNKKISLSTRLLVVLNIIAVLFLFIAYVAPYVSPSFCYPISFFGLAYPVLLIINLFFVLFWGVFLKKYFLISTIAILIGYSHLRSFVSFSNPNILATGKEIKVMSYNVRLFDLYNWNNMSGVESRTAIFNLFNQESPDILLLQEYYSGEGKKANFADTISLKAGFKYKYIELLNKTGNSIPYGLALFSKYPIIKSFKVAFSNSNVNYIQVADILIDKDTIRTMNLHLESIKFGKEDYNFVSDIANIPKNEKLKKGSVSIFEKMRSAYIRRTPQVDMVAEEISKSPYPIILAGDFNDTPVSYTYRNINKQLNDAFVSAGSGLGETYVEKIPYLRIDYIFHSKRIIAKQFKTLKDKFSDHYPLIGNFVIPE